MKARAGSEGHPDDVHDAGHDARERLAALGEIAAEVAHELHNVLQIISASAFVARLAVARGDAAGAAPHVLKIEKNARAGHAIVDDLMALARGDALRTESVAFADTLADAREGLEGAAAFTDTLELPDARVRANPGLLARLLHVLYENAVQASAPRPPAIATTLRIEPARVVIEVADDGPGIPPDIAQRVFDPLFTARPGGTGLGLALARRIAAAHGGSLGLATPTSSEREGGPRGAAFRLELPR